MKTLTIEQFVDDQESILKRVEKGEKIAVTDGEVSAVLVSSHEYLYQLKNNDAPQLDLDYNFSYTSKVTITKQ